MSRVLRTTHNVLKIDQVVQLVTARIQMAYEDLLPMGIDGPAIEVDYHRSVDVPYPFFRPENLLNVPILACAKMTEDQLRDRILDCLAWYGAWTDYRQIQRSHRYSVNVRTVRRPTRPVYGDGHWAAVRRHLARR